MRAAPPFRVSVQRFGAWRGAVWLLALCGAAALLMWLINSDRATGSAWTIVVVLAMTVILLLARSVSKTAPVDLRWDGRVWLLGPSLGEPVPGDIAVAIDLGIWMLLRFTMPTDRPRMAPVWLPVQRRGLEPHWHALRCSVYSPRPAPDDDQGAGLGDERLT